MCGRYSFPEKMTPDKFSSIIQELELNCPQVRTGDINPGDVAAVISRSRRLTARLFPMHWGFHLPNGRLVFNARSETASSKPLFRDGMLQRRCLIPAEHYYEWEKTDSGKQKYAISPKSSSGFYLGGIYRLEDSSPVFTILTRESSPEIAFIHDRMPLIIPEEMGRDWLDPKYKADELIAAIVPDMEFHPCQ